MYPQSGYRYSSTCSGLSTAIQELRGTLRVAEQNEILREDYKKKKAQHDGNVRFCNNVIEALKPVIGSTKEYLDTRKTESLQNLNNALRMAGEIIQDAMTGIRVSIDKGTAMIVDEDGCEVQLTEGGGYRQISSAFLRHAVLSMAPQYLNTLFLDETFALVNVENSATLSSYLELMSRTTQIISIEQKPEIYANLDHISYTFKKAEKYSTVEREEHVTSEVS